MKICFVSLNIYPLLFRNTSVQLIGGAELQQYYIGRELAKRGFEISYITSDIGRTDINKSFDDFKVYTAFRPDEGIFGIRFIYPRLYKIWMSLKVADADIYYVKCASFLTGVLAHFCKRYNKKFIFASAHDTDFMPDKVMVPTIRDKILYFYGLKRANMIFTQSDYQKKLLKNNFDLDSYVVKNFYPQDPIMTPEKNRKIILWISSIRKWKKPELFINLAKLFPEERFVMIGGPDRADEDYYKKIEKIARDINNLEFLGFQHFHITEEYFNKCKIFINTSEYEGFPNTFLQAWSRGIPVISFFNPDNIIEKNNLGFVFNSEEELVNKLRIALLKNQIDYEKIIEYFSKNHSSKVINQYILYFQRLSQTR